MIDNGPTSTINGSNKKHPNGTATDLLKLPSGNTAGLKTTSFHVLMQPENLNKIRKKVVSIFDRYISSDYLLFIFGSFTKDSADRASDIDLAVYCDHTLPSSLIAEIRGELENSVPTLRTFDVVNLTIGGISTNLLESILKEGQLWKRPRSSKGLLRNLRRHLKNSQK